MAKWDGLSGILTWPFSPSKKNKKQKKQTQNKPKTKKQIRRV